MPNIREVKEIPLDDLEIGKGQARLRHVEKDIDELADSIRVVGLLEPIVVCDSDTPGKYEIIIGQRRFLAHQKLQKATILATVLDEHVDENTAKFLSVTENLVRRDLDSKDLIDACIDLYKRYGSMKAVADETGLPYDKVCRYVKYDRLIPELKELVDKGEVKLPAALRAQDAASVSGAPDPLEAVEFAKEMTSMSGTQRDKIVGEREKNPSLSSDQAIEDAKTGGKVTQILVTLTSPVHGSLQGYAKSEETSMDDAASMLIHEGLQEKGYLEGS